MDLIISVIEDQIQQQQEVVNNAFNIYQEKKNEYAKQVKSFELAYLDHKEKLKLLQQELTKLKEKPEEKPVTITDPSELIVTYVPTGNYKKLVDDPTARVRQYSKYNRHLICSRLIASSEFPRPLPHELHRMFHYDNNTNKLYRKNSEGYILYDDPKPVGRFSSSYMPIIAVNGKTFPIWEIVCLLRYNKCYLRMEFMDRDTRNFREDNMRPYGNQLA